MAEERRGGPQPHMGVPCTPWTGHSHHQSPESPQPAAPRHFPHLRSWQFFCRNLRVTLHLNLPLRPHIHPRADPLVSTFQLHWSPGHSSQGLPSSHLDHHWSPNETSHLTLPFVPPPCLLSPWKAHCLTFVGRRYSAVPLCSGQHGAVAQRRDSQGSWGAMARPT